MRFWLWPLWHGSLATAGPDQPDRRRRAYPATVFGGYPARTEKRRRARKRPGQGGRLLPFEGPGRGDVVRRRDPLRGNGRNAGLRERPARLLLRVQQGGEPVQNTRLVCRHPSENDRNAERSDAPRSWCDSYRAAFVRRRSEASMPVRLKGRTQMIRYEMQTERPGLSAAMRRLARGREWRVRVFAISSSIVLLSFGMRVRSCLP